MKGINEAVLAILARLSNKQDGKIDGDLIYNLGFDSKRVMQLIVSLENEFNISIREEDLDIDNFNSVDTIVKLVTRYQSEILKS